MSTRRRGTIVSIVSVVIAALLLPAGSVLAATTFHEGGYGPGSLRLAVLTDTLDGTRAAAYLAHTGSPVHRVYQVSNTGEADLDLHVDDPDGAVRCPTGHLAALASVRCTADFPSKPGLHGGFAVVSGLARGATEMVTARAPSAYRGGYGSLRVTVTVSRTLMPEGTPVVVHAAVTNTGDSAVRDVRVTGIGCSGGDLAPGRALTCETTLRPKPGRHALDVTAIGSEELPEIRPDGPRPGPPDTVSAQDRATFVVVAASTPPGSGAPSVPPGPNTPLPSNPVAPRPPNPVLPGLPPVGAVPFPEPPAVPAPRFPVRPTLPGQRQPGTNPFPGAEPDHPGTGANPFPGDEPPPAGQGPGPLDAHSADEAGSGSSPSPGSSLDAPPQHPHTTPVHRPPSPNRVTPLFPSREASWLRAQRRRLAQRRLSVALILLLAVLVPVAAAGMRRRTAPTS